MFTNLSATTPNPSFNNNNNSNQPLQTGMFSVPTNPPNNSFGSLPPQPTTFGSMGRSGGLLGNPYPSGALFGNPIQQQSQGAGGGLFSNQIQQQPQTGGLLGNPQSSGGIFGHPTQQFGGGLNYASLPGTGSFDPSKMHTLAPRSTIPLNGTVDYIGRNNVKNCIKNKDGHYVYSMTARITGHTLDEHRMADYYNLKNNRLKTDEKRTIFLAILGNLSRVNPPGNQPQSRTVIPPILDGIMKDPTMSSFPTNMANSQLAPLSESQVSGSLLTNPQPLSLQISPSPLMTANNPSSNQPSAIQSSSLPTKTPVSGQPEVKTMKSIEKKKPLELSSGSFSYEFNKMLFVSGLVQLMEKHNMTVPENLLDDTDFASQLLAFLEQHNISLPTENVPQFQINSTQSADECE